MTHAGPCVTPTPRRARGFTLVELLVTMSIIAILLALAAPSFVSFQRNSELTSTANDFVAAVSAARAEALKRQRNTFVIPADSAHVDWTKGWVVYVDMNGDQSYQLGTDITVAKTDPIPSTVTVVPAGGMYLKFNGAGFLVTLANAMAANWQLDFNSVTGEGRRIIANPAGRLRVCKSAPVADTGCSANVL